MTTELRNMIRVGTVSTVDTDRGTVRVTFPDKDDYVSDELPVLRLGGTFTLPQVGENAVCLFLGNGIRAGFYLGTYYTTGQTVPTGASGGVVIDGDLEINGLTAIAGDLDVTGDVTIGGTLHGGGIGP
jgi:phage baseplate assembly protein gpV